MSAPTALTPGPSAASRSGDRRTLSLLEAPLVPTLLKLATPNVLGLVAATIIIGYDGWIIGRLGADALAGVALVLPLSMLMMQMSAGAMGGTVAAAVARALGAGQRAEADRTAHQALWIALGMAAIFATVLAGFGRPIFTALGGRGGVLEAALDYAVVVFGGAFAMWACNLLAGVVRGSGNMVLPAAMLALVAALHVALAPLLVFGAGTWPGLGVAGAGASLVACNLAAAAVLFVHLVRGRGSVRLHRDGWALHGRKFRALLSLGLVTSLSPLLSNVSIATATALVAVYGTAALAGFGLAARLEYIVVPIAFGFGSALTTLVATNIGAGQRERALRAAWIGAGIVAALTGTIGIAAAIEPAWWMNAFSDDAQVRAYGGRYLRIVGGCYGLFGFGLALYFASQGAQRMFWPIVGSFARVGVVGIGGFVAARWLNADLGVVFGIVAGGFVAYAGVIAGAIFIGRWAR